jgi:para-aminobenzoate synthetase component I
MILILMLSFAVFCNEAEKYVSFSVGSAITAASIPELEYDECQLKAKAMFEVLKSEYPVSLS